MVRREGLRIPTGSAKAFLVRVRGMSLSGRLLSEVAPLLAALVVIHRQIVFSDSEPARIRERDEVVEEGQTQNDVPMRDGFEDVVVEEQGELGPAFGLARRTEPRSLAGEGDREVPATSAAEQASQTSFEDAIVLKGPDAVDDDIPKDTEFGSGQLRVKRSHPFRSLFGSRRCLIDG